MSNNKILTLILISILVLFQLFFERNFFSLSNAAYMGEKWRVSLLIALGKDVNEVKCSTYKDYNGSLYCYTPLIFSIYNNDIYMIDELLSRGADTMIPENNLPLELAIRDNKEEAVSLLINAGAKLENTKFAKFNVFESDNPKFLSLLTDIQPMSAEELYCEVWEQYNILEYLLKSGVNPDLVCDMNKPISSDCNKIFIQKHRTKLFRVSDLDGFEGKHNANIAQLLIDYNANIDFKDYCDNTPLHHAAKTESIYIIKTLLENNATLGIKNCDGKTAYELAKNNKWALKAFDEHLKKISQPK